MKRTVKSSRRQVRAIVKRGSVEPVMLLFGIYLLTSGLTLLRSESTPVMPFPWQFGLAQLFLLAVGGVGIVIRSAWLKAAFGFLGMFLRTWMAVRFFLANPFDIAWCGSAAGAVGYGWVFIRCACRHSWKKGLRQRHTLQLAILAEVVGAVADCADSAT